MKAFLILAALVAVASAGNYDNNGPSRGIVGGIRDSGFDGGISGARAGGQVFRHVYVHTAPDEPEDRQSRVIRVPGQANKHVNIIFVKTPSSSFNQETEVILPEQDQQKNLVYVLLKKNEANSNVRIRGPGPTQPTKPEVYFIRYKDGQQQQQDTGSNYQPAAPLPVRRPSSAYGTPF